MEERRHRIDSAMDVLIVLAIVAATVEAAADAMVAPLRLREALGFASVAFDVVFVLDFAARFGDAVFEGRINHYWGRGLGWMDCLTSLPILAFVSGPFAIGAVVGSAANGAFAVARALGPLRSLRALRLLRTIRILSSLKGRDTVVTKRHIVLAASLSMGAVVLSILLVEAVSMALGGLPHTDLLRIEGVVSLCATFASLAVAIAIVFIYGPYFSAGVASPLLASIRWIRGEDSRVRALAPADRADEEPFVLASLLDDKALREVGGEPRNAIDPDRDEDPPWPEPTGQAEMEGLLAKAQAYSSPDEDTENAERPFRG